MNNETPPQPPSAVTVGQEASEETGERIALNAAMLRLFKGKYGNSGDRHSDALFVKDGLEAALIETANLRRELEENDRINDEIIDKLSRENEKRDDYIVKCFEATKHLNTQAGGDVYGIVLLNIQTLLAAIDEANARLAVSRGHLDVYKNEAANLRRELEAATKERDDALKELRPVEKYVQTLTNRVPIDVVLQVVRTCAILGHEKYPKSML